MQKEPNGEISNEMRELVHDPSYEAAPVFTDVENLDFYPGDIDDFATSIESLWDFHKREVVAMQKIRSKYRNTYGLALTNWENADIGQKANLEAGVVESQPVSNLQQVKGNSTLEEARAKTALPQVKQRRREIWTEVLRRQYFDPAVKDEFGKLLNLLTRNNLEGHLEQVLQWISNAKDAEAVEHLARKSTEIYNYLLEIESLTQPKGFIESLRYLGGVDLINYIDVPTEDKEVIDWEGLREVLGDPDEDGPLISDKAAIPPSSSISLEAPLPVSFGEQLKTSIGGKAEKLPALFEKFQKSSSRRKNAHEIELVIAEVNDAHAAVCIERPDGVFVIVQAKDWEGSFLADPKTGKALSERYTEIAITPHNGLILVGGRKDGYGYINYEGKEIFKPDGGYVPKYHNGSELVFDGGKVINIETGKIVAENQGGDEINVFGNLVTTKVLAWQVGPKKVFDSKLLDSQGKVLDFGDPEDIKVVTTRTDPVPYTSDTGRSETTKIITNVAVKKDGKFGLLNSLNGELILPLEYKNISSFHGGVKPIGKSRIKPVYNPEGELEGHEEMRAMAFIDLIMVEKEGDGFLLLDEKYNDMLGAVYRTKDDLERAYDEKYPDNKRFIKFLW